MIRLEGTKELKARRDVLSCRLTDLSFLVRCVPDVAEVKEITPTSALMIVRPGFAFIRGELQLRFEKLAEEPPQSARYLITSKGVGSNSAVEAHFQLEAQNEQSLLRWTAEVKELGGLLKAIPPGLIKAAAQKIVTDLLAGVERELGKEPV
jgi:carbon monoxide dehydrogenase subunit G